MGGAERYPSLQQDSSHPENALARQLALAVLEGDPPVTLWPPSGGELDQTVECDGELANANPRRVPDRVGNGTGRSSDPDLADTLDPERVDVRVILLDQNRFNRGYIRVHRHVVFAKIRVHHATGTWINDGVLMQGK